MSQLPPTGNFSYHILVHIMSIKINRLQAKCSWEAQLSLKFEDNFSSHLLLIPCYIKVNAGRLHSVADESVHVPSMDLNPSKPEARKHAANSSLGLQIVELFVCIPILDVLYVCHVFSLKNYLLLVHLYFFSLPSYAYTVFFD